MDNVKKELVSCALCNGACFRIYKMGPYDIFQCRKCGTGRVEPFPSEAELKAFYDGFHASLSVDSILHKLPIAKLLLENLDVRGEGLRFLDVGGGSGLFSKAFEEYGFGKSTYVDLDPKACAFVKDELGVENVLHTDVLKLTDAALPPFDLIYSRHLIEHLTDPLGFIEDLLKLKAEGGKVVIQCPNGDSLEYLAYYWSNLKNRYYKIKQASGYSKYRILWIWLTGGILHGIDPPRHLWAFSRKGIRIWAKKKIYDVDVFTTDLGDTAFSSGYSPRRRLRERIMDAFGRLCVAKIRGGTHLVAVFR